MSSRRPHPRTAPPLIDDISQSYISESSTARLNTLRGPPATMPSRARPPAPGSEEVGTTINLGELQHSTTLSLSEARLILNRLLDTRRRQNPQNVHHTEVLQRTLDHVETFARHKEDHVVEQVSVLLQNVPQLENYERSKIGDLCPENAEEAKTLIPSLTNKISDADLDALLKEINNLRGFGD